MLLVAGAPGVAAQQLDGLDDRPVGVVVGAELQGLQDPGEHPAVVGRVRGAQHGADPLVEDDLVRPRLPDQVVQGPLAHHREDRLAHHVVGMGDGGLGQAEEDAVLVAHPAQLGGELALHLLLGPGVTAVDEADQQIHQAVGDLGGACPAQGSEQGEAHGLGRGSQVRGVQFGGPGPPGGDQLLGGVVEQVRRQPDRPYALGLVDFLEKGLQAEGTGIRLHLRQEAAFPAGDYQALAGVVGFGCQLLQPYDGRLRKAGDSAGAELPLAGGPGAAEDPLDAAWAGGLDALGATPRQEGGSLAGLGQLDGAHLLGQPHGELLLVGNRRLPEAERLADLGAVKLDRAATPGVVDPGLEGDLHLLGHILHGGLRYLAGVIGKAALQLEELEEQAEPE